MSFVVRHGDRLLHHQLLVTLLSDLFGIQARGGCSCAGPYGHALLGIGPAARAGIEREVLRGHLGIKPGWARVSFPYFLAEPVFDYVLRALHFIADHGWRFLSQYRFDVTSGAWSHRSGARPPGVRLAAVDYQAGRMRYPRPYRRPRDIPLAYYLEEAMKLAGVTSGEIGRAGASSVEVSDEFERLRWFPLPGDTVAAPRTAGATTAASPGS